MPVTDTKSLRPIRVLLLLAAVLGACLAVSALPSSAAADEPFKIEFDKSNIQIGDLADLPLDTIASGASLEGTIDENGNVTIPKGSFKLPELGIDDPVKLRGFMGIESPATGTFDAATGRLELDAKAGIWISVDVAAALDLAGVDIDDLIGQVAGGSTGGLNIGTLIKPLLSNLTCGFSPMDVHFTTEANSLSTGSRFVDGPTGTGAITAEWSQLGPFSGRTKILGLIDPCQMLMSYLPTLLEGGLGGSLPGDIDLGGLDLAGILDNLNNLNLGPSAITLTRTQSQPDPDPDPDPDPTPGPAKLRLSVTPKQHRVKAGKKTTFKTRVKNVGKSKANGVRVCLTGPGVGILVRWRCLKLGSIKAGATKTKNIRVRVKRKSPRRKAKFHFRVKSANAAKRATSARLLIRR